MTKSFFFYGIYEGMSDKAAEEVWEALHKHFEKLAREDDDAVTETVFTDRKAYRKRAAEHDGL